LIEALGLPLHILGEIVPPGTLLGPLLPHLAETAALDGAPVFASAGHDTAAAVAAVPASGTDWCYISSGTWSLMGVELDEPVINRAVLEANFTNEVGVAGKIRFLKNIAGLWLLQECRRAWALEGTEYSYGQLADMAAEARPFPAIVPPDRFIAPGRMPERIAAFCRSSGQTAPATHGEMARAILEGLALRYREVLETLESLTGRTLATVHIVGGGSRNKVLNQFAADATRRRVVAGPAEATATGNILVQAIGKGQLADLPAAREVVRKSFPVELYEPANSAPWDAAYHRFKALA
jgi:rhamnulokinase